MTVGQNLIRTKVSGAVELFSYVYSQVKQLNWSLTEGSVLVAYGFFWPDSVILACELHSEPRGECFRRRQEPAVHCSVYRQAIVFLTVRGTCLTNRAIGDGKYPMEQTE